MMQENLVMERIAGHMLKPFIPIQPQASDHACRRGPRPDGIYISPENRFST